MGGATSLEFTHGVPRTAPCVEVVRPSWRPERLMGVGTIATLGAV